MSGAGFEKLGEGLMTIGGNYINLTQKDLENKVEVIKQKALSDMHIQDQHQKGTLAFAELAGKDEDRKIQQEQFGKTLTLEQKKLDQRDRELDLNDKKHRERIQLDTYIAETNVDHKTATLAFDKYKFHMVEGRLTEEGEKRLALDYAKLAELKRSHRAAEGIQKQTLELQIRTAEANMQAVIDRLALEKLKHMDTLSLSQRTFEHQKDIDHINASISQGNLNLAENQLKVKQFMFLKEFGLKSDKFNYDKSHTNRSFLEQRRQFNQSLSLKQTELKVVQARLALDVKDQSDRTWLNERQADLNDEIQALNVQKHELDKTNSVQERAYKDIMGQVAKRGIKIEEQKFTIDKEAHKRGQWKITSRDVFETKAETDPATGAVTYTDVKVGEEIVAINIDDEGLHDVRILQNDGTWMFGSPDGANEGHQAIIKVISAVMKRKGINFKEARDEVQAHWQSGQLFKDTPYKQKNWDKFMNTLLVVSSEKQGATTGAGTRITGEAAGEPTATTPSASTPSDSFGAPNKLGLDQHGNPYEVGDHVKGQGYIVKVETQNQRAGMGAYTKKYIYTYADEPLEATAPVPVPAPADTSTPSKKGSPNVGDYVEGKGWVTGKQRSRHGFTYSYSQEDPNK
tara:strand:- start:591 stop:2474 length:1884 start_codon:yes stop_codon:yes gene_type:complete